MNAHKFKTLEDYQNSIKEFEDKTRANYEDFILRKAADRQKMQSFMYYLALKLKMTYGVVIKWSVKLSC